MESHSVTCHLTQVNAARLNPSQYAGTLDLPTPEGWKAYRTRLPSNALVWSRTHDLSITRPTPNHYITELQTLLPHSSLSPMCPVSIHTLALDKSFTYLLTATAKCRVWCKCAVMACHTGHEWRTLLICQTKTELLYCSIYIYTFISSVATL